MANSRVKTGYSSNGLPYTLMGNGPRYLVIFDGLDFSHKPPSGLMLLLVTSSYNRLGKDYTVYIVSRKAGLPVGYTMKEMSNDYAAMIKNDIKRPVDIMGISTGGAIAQYFAVDHPDLVNRLVLASTGYRLSEKGKQLQRQFADLISEGKWRTASALMGGVMVFGIAKPVFISLFWLFGKLIFGSPSTPSDGLVELEAEDVHDFKNQLADIRVPTLVIGGENDVLYPIRETAAGIPNARLILYERVGHAAPMKRQFSEDVLTFLNETAL